MKNLKNFSLADRQSFSEREFLLGLCSSKKEKFK